MLLIKKFKIDKSEKNNKILCEKIVHCIIQTIQDKNIKEKIKIFSKCLNISEKIVNQKFKQLIFKRLNFKEGKFDLSFSYIKVFLSFLALLSALIYFFLAGRQNVKKKQYDLIIDDIEAKDDIIRFNKIIKSKKKILIIYKNKNLKKILDDYKCDKIYYNRGLYININNNFLKNNFLNFVKVFTIFFLNSINDKFDYLYFFNRIFIKFVRYNNFYSQNISSYTIQDRFYLSCPIKNFLFKNYGGKKSLCTQIHLIEACISFFVDLDVLLTIGDEKDSQNKLKNLGGRVHNCFPIGSHKMESMWYRKKRTNRNKNKSIDILMIGLNPSSFYWVTNPSRENFYTYLKWMKNISIKNPKLNIIYKHHPNFHQYSSKEEDEILKNSNIKKIISTNNISENSYDFLFNSKICLSYGSTMILEGIGGNQNCYFIDPGEFKSTFLFDLNYLQSKTIKDYKSLEKVVNSQVVNSINSKYFDNKICNKSENVSENILKFIDSYEKK